ncbi:MAG TPA: hypothetical protein VFT95_18360, partial [Micromonosporaceae bacterium]|nr:hypothetical protein [Micromonosporaceae bacterium]
MSVLAAPPEPAGRLATDWPRLRDYLAATRDAVAGLPPLPRRTAPARATAECLVTNGRRARARFLAVHAASVCDEATGGRGLRLDPVAYAIADAFPGLAPSRAEIEGERRHRQCDKAGAEVDQGILFWALLRVPRIADRLVDAMLA